MESSQKIELYRQREFGDKLNAAFAFIRQNARPYFKTQLYISGPWILILSIITIILQWIFIDTVFAQSFTGIGAGMDGVFDFGAMMMGAGFTVFVYIFLTLIIALSTLGYMREYELHPEGKVEVKDVSRRTWSLMGKGILLSITIGIVVALGFVFFIIPGIYVAVALSIALIVLANENTGVINSMDRSFKLTKGKWWSTFGLLVVTGIIGSILTYVLQVPVYILMAVTMVNDTDALQSGAYFTSNGFQWINVLSTILSYAGLILSGMIVYITMAFQYYNLVEMKESRGLLGKIENVNTTGSKAEDQGEY